mgnify:CR=1 FL=1
MKAHYLKLYAYNEWANALFEKVLSDSSYKNEKIDLLWSHIAAVQLLWLNRIQPIDQPVPDVFEARTPAENSPFFDYSQKRLVTLIESTEEFGRIISYQTLEGENFSNRLADLLTHLANHGTHHRSQIALLLREEGIAPPASDYFYYLRALED